MKKNILRLVLLAPLLLSASTALGPKAQMDAPTPIPDGNCVPMPCSTNVGVTSVT